MKKAILGYVVSARDGAMMMCDDKLLYFGSEVTLFANRSAAARAVQRTIRDYNSNSTPQSRWDFVESFGMPRIKRVVNA